MVADNQDDSVCGPDGTAMIKASFVDIGMLQALQLAMSSALRHLGIENLDQLEGVDLKCEDGKTIYFCRGEQDLLKIECLVQPNGSGYDAIGRVCCCRNDGKQ